ncbi:hypothetical protein B0H21DRAFT_820784 [Amylocystis lapponica]|nr:hypothetical protein B0H21DRAFT_820784 [Amylocystis lapponica]
MPIYGKQHNNQGTNAEPQGPVNDSRSNNNAAGVDNTSGYSTHGLDAGSLQRHRGRAEGTHLAGGGGHMNQQHNNNPRSDQGIQPASHVTNGQHGSGGGGGGGRRLEGKMEYAVGSLVGSQALKNKGVQKEQEAGAIQAQSSEIAEAERLEQEALVRREHAVAHGAHPNNKHLGGRQAAQENTGYPYSNGGGATY